MRNWLPIDLAPLESAELETTGSTRCCVGPGVHMRIANQRIGARAATSAQGRLLGVRAGAPLLTMERTSFDDTGHAVEYSSHDYRADAYSFETTLVDR